MKKNYTTKQKQLVVDFVKETRGSHFSVDSIYKKITESEYTMGKATVYRHIKDLAEEGIIKKYASDFGKSACYEYVEEPGKSTYHFKCTTCDKLLHVNCLSLDELQKHILQEHSFKIDKTRMAFVGECEECRTKKEVRGRENNGK